jgi:hypothetical protein
MIGLLTPLLLLILGVSLIGFPSFVNRAVEAMVAEQGMDLESGRIRWVPGAGVWVDDVRVYLHPSDQAPAFEAERLVLYPRWLQRQAGSPPVRGLRIVSGAARISAAGLLLEDERSQWLELHQLNGRVRVDGHNQLLVEALQGQLSGIALEVTAAIPQPGGVGETGAALDVQKLYDGLAAQDAWLPALIRTINQIDIQDAASLRVDVTPDPQQANRYGVTIAGESGRTTLRGLVWDGLRVQAAYRDGVWRFSELALQEGTRVLTAEGRLETETGLLAASVDSTVRPVYWQNLLPVELRELLNRMRLHLDGDTRLQLVQPAARLDQLGRTFEGHLTASDLSLHGVQLAEIDGTFARSGDVLRFEDVQARLADAAGGGTASGWMHFDVASSLYEGALTASCDPHAFLPVAQYAKAAAGILQSLEVHDVFPELDVVFSGRAAPPQAFAFHGPIRGQQFVFQGSQIDLLDADFLFTNGVLRIDPLYAERAEGKLQGWYEQDFKAMQTRLAVDSEWDPRVLARLGGRGMEALLRPYRFEGPVRVTVSGVIDYGKHEATDYRAVARGEQVGWRWATFDRCQLDWIGQGDQIIITNVQSRIFDGYLEGNLMLQGLGHTPLRYDGVVYVDDVSFPSLMRSMRQTEENLQEGRLSLVMDLRGTTQQDWRADLEADGHLAIRRGQIFQIPLFGGLSTLLSRLIPGLGFATQTAVRAPFTISDRVLRSDDVQIHGNLLSIAADGTYHLDDRLDFSVRVKPLRRGLLVDAIRLITDPVSRLLQFRLTGPLGDPRWAIAAWPRAWDGTEAQSE